MPTYKTSVTPQTEDDILELMAFYADLVDDSSAIKFKTELDKTIRGLSEFPRRNAMFDGQEDIRRANMKNHKVAIIYLVDDERLEVIAVRAFHALKDPVQARRDILARLNK